MMINDNIICIEIGTESSVNFIHVEVNGSPTSG